MVKRYRLWEQSDDGAEYITGNVRGYETVVEAISHAKRIAKTSNKTIGIGLFEMSPLGDRDCLEVIGFETPE